jgi:SAM-dependent methyltransferase
MIGAREEETQFAKEALVLPRSIVWLAYRGVRRTLRRVGPLRSAWHLFLALRECLRDSSQRSRDQIDREFQRHADPWRYTTNAREQERFNREARMLDAVREGRLFQNVLEVGCAEGAFTELLAPRCESLLAVDISGIAVARTRVRRCWDKHVRCERWDLRRDPVPDTFDLIVVMHVWAYIRCPTTFRKACAKLVESLRPGGYLLVGEVSQAEMVENSWWSRCLLHSGSSITEFHGRHPALRVVSTATTDLGDCTSIEALFRRIL